MPRRYLIASVQLTSKMSAPPDSAEIRCVRNRATQALVAPSIPAIEKMVVERDLQLSHLHTTAPLLGPDALDKVDLRGT